jgi:DNA-binding XRE family transcriptional regulator
MEDMGNNESKQPYKALGSKLKFLREQWNQSLSEVSGTLEIEEQLLHAIEEGKTLPADELLDMLISHFLLTDEQARELRQMVDSEKGLSMEALATGIDDMLMKQIIMLMPSDNKTIYTDGMQATINDNGVVMQFMQQTKPGGQQVPVAKVGMSRQHAERIIKVLQDTMREYDRNQKPRYLSEPEQN